MRVIDAHAFAFLNRVRSGMYHVNGTIGLVSLFR